MRNRAVNVTRSIGEIRVAALSGLVLQAHSGAVDSGPNKLTRIPVIAPLRLL